MGRGFAPMVCVYCLMLWLIQQPVPLPQQPCWSPQGHLKTDAWLITRVSESHSWYDGSVAKHKLFKHLLLPFCHLFLDQTLSSTVSFHVWPMANRPASSSQTQMIGCKDQDPGALVSSQRSKILPQVNFLCLRTWRDRELPGALRAVRSHMEETQGLARQTPWELQMREFWYVELRERQVFWNGKKNESVYWSVWGSQHTFAQHKEISKYFLLWIWPRKHSVKKGLEMDVAFSTHLQQGVLAIDSELEGLCEAALEQVWSASDLSRMP